MSLIVNTDNHLKDKVASAVIVAAIGEIFATKGIHWSGKDLVEFFKQDDETVLSILTVREEGMVAMLKGTRSYPSVLESVRAFLKERSSV